MQKFCREVVIWKTLRHQNILPLLGVTADDYQFAILSKWMASGSINNFIETHGDVNRFELVSSRSLLLAVPGADNTFQLEDVAAGLIYMHGQGVVHGDLRGVRSETPMAFLI